MGVAPAQRQDVLYASLRLNALYVCHRIASSTPNVRNRERSGPSHAPQLHERALPASGKLLWSEVGRGVCVDELIHSSACAHVRFWLFCYIRFFLNRFGERLLPTSVTAEYILAPVSRLPDEDRA